MNKHHILSLDESCTGCFACANICPKNAISLPPNKEGFYFPKIDTEKCINCGLCDKVCPQIQPIPSQRMQKAFYGWSKDDIIRKQSSSGGLFAYLANMVLQIGGIVFGAAFNYEGVLRLECHSTDEVDIKELQRSKYVQSYIGYAYRDIKAHLKDGRIVLFSGTPCQNAGLLSYLKRRYENLILVDFVCHGVPSMDLLLKHLDYLGFKNVKEINFRPKNRGWVDDFEIRYQFKFCWMKQSTTRLYRVPWSFDEYFGTFERYQSIRRSCRICSYCNGDRCSDITLADFWGINNYKPEQWDKRGISLLLVNSDKGFQVVAALEKQENCFLEKVDLSYAQYVYERIRTLPDSPYQNNVRDRFLNDVYSMGYKKALERHNLKINTIEIYKYRIKQLLRRCKSLLHI